MEPDTFKGALFWAAFGFGAVMLMLLGASLAPNLIPAKAQGVNL